MRKEREMGGLLWPSISTPRFFSSSLLYAQLACAAGGISGPVQISLRVLNCLSGRAERRLGTAMGGGSAKT